MKLETLYKLSTKGATQVLDMTINGAVYTRIWGQVGGKMQYKATTAIGKNIGRANETSPEAQAILEAEAVWTKKQKDNYSTSLSAPVTKLLPMKVNNYHDHTKKIVFPCMVSPKLNGVNCEYRIEGNTLKLYSRGGEEYPIPDHQKLDAIAILAALGTDSINGEMYVHGHHLQDIMAATKKHNDLTPELIFYMFDVPNIPGDFATRCGYAYNIIQGSGVNPQYIQTIRVDFAHSYEEIASDHAKVTALGYEGLIVRNTKGLYKYNTRSLDVFKYKTTMDAEFEITAVTADKNGHPVMTFKSAGGEFKAKPKGTSQERISMLNDSHLLIGKFATVEYEMLSKGAEGLPGKPLKPVMITLRECDHQGNPKV